MDSPERVMTRLKLASIWLVLIGMYVYGLTWLNLNGRYGMVWYGILI